MNTEQIPGFNEYKESLLAKIEEPLTQYILCRMKLDQYQQSSSRTISVEEQMRSHLNFHADYIAKSLIID